MSWTRTTTHTSAQSAMALALPSLLAALLWGSALAASSPPLPFVSSRFVVYNSSNCTLPWTGIQTERLGECYYSGGTSWVNNCSADGRRILRTYWGGGGGAAGWCVGAPRNVTTTLTGQCAGTPRSTQSITWQCCPPGACPAPFLPADTAALSADEPVRTTARATIAGVAACPLSLNNTDYIGDNKHEETTATSGACCALCAGIAPCQFWTFEGGPHTPGPCFLKAASSTPGGDPRPGRVSGRVATPHGGSPRWPAPPPAPPAPPAPPFRCRTLADCSLNGVCRGVEACHCDPGWRGQRCQELDLLPARRRGGVASPPRPPPAWPPLSLHSFGVPS